MANISTDEDTKKRIKNLSIVGHVVFQISNEATGTSDVFLAKSALSDFKKDINILDLDPQTKAGIDSLIKFLENTLDKKMNQLM